MAKGGEEARASYFEHLCRGVTGVGDSNAVQFLVRTKVLTKDEIHSRFHIGVERYNKTLEIELRTLLELAQSYVLPAVETQINRSSDTLKCLTTKTPKMLQTERVQQLEETLGTILSASRELSASLDKVAGESDEIKRMKWIAKETIGLGAKLRKGCDAAELLVADELWTLPKYRDMLFANTLT